MDKDILRRLGWGDELIEAVGAVTVDRPNRRWMRHLHGIDLLEVEGVSSTIDMSESPVTASSIVPPSGFRHKR